MLHNVSVKKFLFCIWYNAMPLNLDTRTPMKMTIAGPDGASASSVAKYVFPENQQTEHYLVCLMPLARWDC